MKYTIVIGEQENPVRRQIGNFEWFVYTFEEYISNGWETWDYARDENEHFVYIRRKENK